MFIQTEPTPDADTLKFLPGRGVLEGGDVSFDDAGAAERSPLAARLFQIEPVARVSLGPDFVAVTKAADADWQLLKPAIFGVIMEHFLTNRPVLIDPGAGEGRFSGGDEAGDARDEVEESDDPEIAAEIRELIDTRVRPGIVSEGGDIAFHGFADGVARLELINRGLATPAFSLQIRVENTLRHYIPEVAAVEFIRPAAAGAEPAPDLGDPETASIHALLEQRVNPAVAAHGGYISLIEVKDHTAYLRLEGGCQGCGMADVTLKQGVEAMILEEVPSIVAVLDVTDHADGDNPYFEPDKSGISPF